MPGAAAALANDSAAGASGDPSITQASEATASASGDNPNSAPADASGAAGSGSPQSQGADASAPSNDNQPGLDWLKTDDGELVEFAKANGWQNPADVVTNIRELQRFLGADKAGRGVVIPKDDGDGEAWGKLYDKLGRPANGEGYGLDAIADADPELAKGAGDAFHKAGLSKTQADQLAKWWGETLVARETAENDAFLAKSETDMAAWRAAQGAAADAQSDAARRGAAALKLDGEQLTKIEKVLGTGELMDRMAALGKALGEDTMPNAAKGGGGALDPGSAKKQIGDKLADRDFMAKVQRNDPTAKAEWDQLFKAAYGAG